MEYKELQNRREFFKNAAKKALPIIGAIALASSPILSQAAEKEPMGCNGCQDYCVEGCRVGCGGKCADHCAHSCSESCVGACRGGCKNGCGNYCKKGCN